MGLYFPYFPDLGESGHLVPITVGRIGKEAAIGFILPK
jgi:hypothetical protein